MTERQTQNSDSKNSKLFRKILKNEKYYAKLPFHLNGHTIGLHPQTQKLEIHTKYTYTTMLPAPVLTFALSALHNTSFHPLHHI